MQEQETTEVQSSMEVQSSNLFTAVFQGKHRGTMCVNSGADGNIMCSRTVDEIIASGVDVEIPLFIRTVFFAWLPPKKTELVHNQCAQKWHHCIQSCSSGIDLPSYF